MNKKIRLILLTIGLIIGELSITICSTQEAFAAYFDTEQAGNFIDSDEGSEATMQAKLYYYALYYCTAHEMKFRAEGNPLWTGRFIKKNNVANGEWFAHESGSVEVGAYLEHDIKGTWGGFDNGSIYCGDDGEDGWGEGEGHNMLLKNAMKVFQKLNSGVTFMGMALYPDGKEGIFADCEEEDDRYCKLYDKYDATNHASVRVNSLTKFMEDKVFKGKVPGGDLKHYTKLEKYYLYHAVFKGVCAGAEGGSTYTIKELEGNKWVEKKYAHNGNDGKLEPTDGISLALGTTNNTNNQTNMIRYSCKSIAQYLNQETEEAQQEAEIYEKHVQEHPGSEAGNDLVETDHSGDEDYGNCKKQYTLGWVICPIIFTAGKAVDRLEEWVDGFFE